MNPIKQVLSENHKICTDCNISKLLSDFRKQDTGRLGVTSKCLICERKRGRKYQRRKRIENGIPENHRKCRNCKEIKSNNDFDEGRTNCKECREKLKKEKKCSSCGEIKPLNEFRKSKTNKTSGIQSKCKKCSSIVKPKEEFKEGFKRCEGKGEFHCNIVKPIKEFVENENMEDGYLNQCKECKKNRGDQWKGENEEHLIGYRKNYYQENKEEKQEWAKNYRQDPEVKKRRNENTQKDREENPHIYAWRGILRRSLDRMGQEKEGHTIDELRYSALDLKEHQKQLFTEGMSWEENYGEWHNDHIIPVIYFKPDIPPYIVNELDNIQPLWAGPNLSKGDKILIEEEKSRELYFKYREHLKDEVIEKYDKLLNQLTND